MKILLFGPPMSGKGTQAAILSQSLHLPHISMGEVIRQYIANKGEIVEEISAYMNKGLLVPDEYIDRLIVDRLSADDCDKGYILDGYPRSLKQAKILESLSTVDIVIVLEIDIESVMNRLTKRRTCRNCGNTTNTDDAKNGICNICGGELYIRDDDNVQAYMVRYKTYQDQTMSAIEYYKSENKLVIVDANDSVYNISNSIKRVIDEYNN